MSVELDVRLGSQSIPVELFVASVSGELRRLFPGKVSSSWPVWGASAAQKGVLGREVATVDLALDDVAVVQVLAYVAGAECDLGEDGGWWACVSVCFRSPESKLLMVVAAACLARLAGTAVVDESSMMGMEREILPASLLALVESSGGASFEEVATRPKRAARL